MPLTPDPPFPKTQGDNIRSKDWNDAVTEVIRLDNAKVNRAGDRITGPLTVGPLSVGAWPANPANYAFVGTSFLDQAQAGNYALLQSNAAGEQGTTFLNSPKSIQFRINNGDKMVLSTDGHLQVLAGGNPLHFTSTWAGYPDAVSNGAEISNDTGTYKTLMIVGNRSAGLGRRVSVWDRLDVNGQLSASNLFVGSAFRIGAGKTTPGATAWQVYSATGIVVNVNTAAAQFSSTPLYVTALHGAGSHWATTGGTSVYSPTPTGFQIYVKWSDSSALTPATANANQWHIQWIGVQI